jgi:hypothetical protein
MMWGYVKRAWDFVRPMLVSQVGKFLADPQVQALAIKCVEKAAQLDLDGDAKFAHAWRELTEELQAIRRRYQQAWVAIAVEAAYQRAKAGAV